MNGRRQEHMAELKAHLDILRGELVQAERNVANLRTARNALFAQLVREEYGIAAGDTVVWLGEQTGPSRRRPLTLRGLVLDVPLEGRLLVRRVNRSGRPMEETLYIPARMVALDSRRSAAETGCGPVAGTT